MLKNLSTYMQEFIANRTDEIGRQVLMNHDEYRKLSNELREAIRALMMLLPEEGRQLVLSFEETENAQAALAGEIMYKQGLLDGLYLGRNF